jgi:predicted ATPase
MYLHLAQIVNVRSLSNVKMTFDSARYAGWHVLLGDNGAGKSTVIRSIALGLIGQRQAVALRQNWADWLRSDQSEGHIRLRLDYDRKYDIVTGRGKALKEYYLSADHRFERVISSSPSLPPVAFRVDEGQAKALERYLWGDGLGWFCCSFGPFRRFSGGNKDYEKLFYSNPRVARHLSAFGEDIALTECLDWLRNLHIQHLDGQGDRQLLDWLTYFLDESGLLPHNTRLVEINASAVIFQDGNGARIPIEQLSDGFRSVLSLTFELIRQLILSFGEDKVLQSAGSDGVTLNVPGIVLIDEIDAHLHPAWQKKIGVWFTACFPNIQFIVTTHSPLVCQAARTGSVWRLPTPGTSEVAHMVEGTDLQRLLEGNILDAYSTELFGRDSGRSEETRKHSARLAQLNSKAVRQGLSDKEEQERDLLRRAMPSSAA